MNCIIIITLALRKIFIKKHKTNVPAILLTFVQNYKCLIINYDFFYLKYKSNKCNCILKCVIYTL